MMSKSPPVVLTIAGTDPSGGAGIQADLKTFTSLQCYGASVVTALTAQNTLGVQDVYAPPPDFVQKQLQSVITDLNVDAIKTGMLFNAAVTQTVIDTLEEFYGGFPHLVVDPVCVSTSGHTLLDPSALSIIRQRLLPLATVITPNKPEAELLLQDEGGGGVSINSVADMLDAAKHLARLGPQAVLLKGGHLVTTLRELNALVAAGQEHNRVLLEWNMGGPNSPLILQKARMSTSGDHTSNNNAVQYVVDVLYECAVPDSYTLFVRPRVDTTSTHGTGCTLAAALACELALGRSVKDAVRNATEYTHRAILTAFPLGGGQHGPLNHLHATLPRLLAPPTPTNPYPFVSTMISGTFDIWKDYVQHPFVKALGAGTLAKECFTSFIKQDYHYLKYYARAQALIAVKSSSLSTIASRAAIMLAVVHETANHTDLCESYGIPKEELETTPEEPETVAYGSYLIDIGMQGDETILMVAVAACLLGYGEVGLWLVDEAENNNEQSGFVLEGNPYKRWIDEYSGERYQEAVRIGISTLEDMMARDPPSPTRLETMRKVWERTVRLEIGFWSMAMKSAAQRS